MARAAVLAVARAEWSRRARAIVVVGLAAGLVGGLVIAGAALTRRTASAPHRLATAVGVGDAQLQTFGDPGVAESITALPMVDESWVAGLSVGRLEGDLLQYVGMLSALSSTGDLVEPVIVEGRTADPTAIDEIVITELLADAVDARPGDRLGISVLTPLEVTQFDTGFGAPDGPTLDLLVVGVTRSPPGMFAGTPVLMTPAFAARYPELLAGADITVGLARGAADRPAFAAAATDIAAAATEGGANGGFPAVAVLDPLEPTRALERSSRVLVGGLVAAVVVAALALLLALGQALARHHGWSAGEQQVELALGMSSRERIAARLLAAAPAAGASGVVAALVAASLARSGPAGGLGDVEPDPGWRFDWIVLVVGPMLTVAVFVVLAAATAWRAGHPSAVALHRRRLGSLGFAPSRRGWPLAGVAFALSPGGGRRQVPVRTSLTGAVAGIAGVVAALTFTASLDRLVDSPERYGWSADLVVVDTTDAIVAELENDPRVDAVTDVISAHVIIDGVVTPAYAFTPRSGDLMWTLSDGRRPVSSDEVLLGTKLAERLGAVVGDRIPVGDGSDTAPVTMNVVGIGIGPPLSNEALGSTALFAESGLAVVGMGDPFREALVGLAAGVEPDAVAADLGARYELTLREVPAEVAEVAALGRLPLVLGGFVAALAALALGHALVLATRRRQRDLAVMRALGATPRQTALTVIAMAVTIVVVGVAIGTPIGWLLGRLVWAELAESIGVAGDVAFGPAIALVPVAAVVTAVLIAAGPAWRVMRSSPGGSLRAE